MKFYIDVFHSDEKEIKIQFIVNFQKSANVIYVVNITSKKSLISRFI